MSIVQKNPTSVEELWKNYNQTRNDSCRNELIVHYLYLVKNTARRIAAGLPKHVHIDDLYSFGITGLVKSVERYEPHRNKKFESYATLLIKGAVIDELRSQDWVPRSLHQKAHRVATAQQYLQQELGRDPTREEIRACLGLSKEQLEDWIVQVQPKTLIPLNESITVQSNNKTISPAEHIADSKAITGFQMAHRRERMTIVIDAVNALPEQECKVLKMYYYEDLMLKEIGSLMGLSESRVSQIHSKALIRLKARLKPIREMF